MAPAASPFPIPDWVPEWAPDAARSAAIWGLLFGTAGAVLPGFSFKEAAKVGVVFGGVRGWWRFRSDE
jgi:hypothetical protein